VLRLFRSYRDFCERRWIWIAAALAVLVFSASMGPESLKSNSDCFYAQEGWEMAESGPSWTVTWDGEPVLGYPPLHFWIMAGFFSMLGKTDLAARLPSLLMGLGVLLATYRIASIAGGRRTAIASTALLLVAPFFVTNARRVMIDLPLAFWTTLALLVYLEGLRRPKLHALMALPLGAAILTKSLLGLMPLFVIPAALVSPALRGTLKSRWLWLGVLGGIAIGASWSIVELLALGPSFLDLHYGIVIVSRAVQSPSSGVLTTYPRLLFEEFQPLVLPAVAGLAFSIRDRIRRRDAGIDLMIAWLVIPLIAYSIADYRFPRYAIPLFPALAFFAGYIFRERLRRTFVGISYCAIPALTIASSIVLWVQPGLLEDDSNQAFKQNTAYVQRILGDDTTLPYVGEEYWPEANAALWYWDVSVEKPRETVSDAVDRALEAPHRSLLCVRADIGAVKAVGVPYETVLEGKNWFLLRFPRAFPLTGPPGGLE
jgi:4-amino-4-deoxy-L-arabinose transferase-like glycosyltransferase